ncbi:hypothetical protein [Streptomyces sp. NPDC001415]
MWQGDLAQLGVKRLFVKAIDVQLQRGNIDMVIPCLSRTYPTTSPPRRPRLRRDAPPRRRPRRPRRVGNCSSSAIGPVSQRHVSKAAPSAGNLRGWHPSLVCRTRGSESGANHLVPGADGSRPTAPRPAGGPPRSRLRTGSRT